MPDELSRSGVLEETQHVFNAALILRLAIQSLQPKIPANQNTGNIEGNSVFRAIVVAS